VTVHPPVAGDAAPVGRNRTITCRSPRVHRRQAHK